MGCVAVTGVTKGLPRGTVEFDVIVDDVTTAPHSLYVCECKQWAKRVPKTIVHGFRTTVAEIGANRGFIISRVGFQSGAREAARWTNIDLLTWADFEALMFDRWVEGITALLNPVFARVHRLNDPNDQHLWDGYECTEEAFNRLWEIGARYSLIDIWALVFWLSSGSLHDVVKIGAKDNTIKAAPRRLDTYRKIVDAAPRICSAAHVELTRFWATLPRSNPPRSAH